MSADDADAAARWRALLYTACDAPGYAAEFHLPGVQTNGVTIVLTVTQSDRAEMRLETLVGQTYLSVRNPRKFEGHEARERWLKLSLDAKPHHMLYDTSGRPMPLRRESLGATASRGELEVQIELPTTLYQLCGNALGPPPDTLWRNDATTLKAVSAARARARARSRLRANRLAHRDQRGHLPL